MITSGLEIPQYRALVANFFWLLGHALVVENLIMWSMIVVYHEHFFHVWTTLILLPLGLALTIFGRGGRGYYISGKMGGRKTGLIHIAAQVLAVNILVVGLYFGVTFLVDSIGQLIHLILHLPTRIDSRMLFLAASCFAFERFFRRSALGGNPIWISHKIRTQGKTAG